MYHFYDAEPAPEVAVLQNTQSKSNQLTQTVRYECSKCDSLFTTRVFLHHHEANIHNRIFHCPFCSALFSNKADFRVHVTAHSEKRYLPCSFCKKVFQDVDEYTAHVKLHREPFMYNCDKCPAMFSQLSKLRTHNAAHVTRKFIHTIPKLSKRIVCPYQNQSRHAFSNSPENNERTTAGPVISVSVAYQTEAPSSPVVSILRSSEPGLSSEPEAGSSRSHKENIESSPENNSSSSDRKRKKKADKQERLLRNKTAVEKFDETDFHALPEDHTEIMSPSLRSGGKNMTRKRGRPPKNKKAVKKITKTDPRGLSEDDIEVTYVTKKQIPSNSGDTEIVHKRNVDCSRKNNKNTFSIGKPSEAASDGISFRISETTSLKKKNLLLAKKQERVQKQILSSRNEKAVEKSGETNFHTLPGDHTEIMSPSLHSGQKNMTRKRGRPPKNKKTSSIGKPSEATSDGISFRISETTSVKKKKLLLAKKQERVQKQILSSRNEKAVEKSGETNFHTLPEDHTEMVSPSLHSGGKNMTRKRGRPPKNKKAVKKITKIDTRGLSEDDIGVTFVTKKQIPSHTGDTEVVHKRNVDCSRRNNKNTSSIGKPSEATSDGISFRISQTTSVKKKNLLLAKKQERVQKQILSSRNEKVVKNTSAVSRVTVSVTPSSSSNAVLYKNQSSSINNEKNIQHKQDTRTSVEPSIKILTKVLPKNTTVDDAAVSRITILKPVILSKTSIIHSNEIAPSESQSLAINQLEKVEYAHGRLCESNLREKTVESIHITPGSSNEERSVMALENNDSVYTFNEEENLNRKTPISNAANESSTMNKLRRRNELWRFFMTSTSPMKKARKTMPRKKRESVHFYKCSSCIRVFPNCNMLNKHQLMHLRNGGVSCNECGGVFAGHGNLILHKKLTHCAPTF